MAAIKTGDYVRIRAREVTKADNESGLYFKHLGGLTGEVTRVAGAEVVVRVERDSLPTDALKMHKHIEERVKDKFLAGLSEEGRRRLTPEEKAVSLNYVVVVKSDDLEPMKGAKPAPKPKSVAEVPPPRATEEDYERAEEEYLRARHPDVEE